MISQLEGHFVRFGDRVIDSFHGIEVQLLLYSMKTVYDPVPESNNKVASKLGNYLC